MPISMRQQDKYVTQSSIYDVPITGPLTNRKIAQYMREGRYGEDMKLKAHQEIKVKRKAKQRREERKKLWEGLFV